MYILYKVVGFRRSGHIYGRRTLLHLQYTKQHHCTNVQELLHYRPPDARFTPPTSLCYSRESTNTHRGSILLQQFGNPSTIVWMNLRKVAYLQKYTVVRFEYTRASPPTKTRFTCIHVHYTVTSSCDLSNRIAFFLCFILELISHFTSVLSIPPSLPFIYPSLTH